MARYVTSGSILHHFAAFQVVLEPLQKWKDHSSISTCWFLTTIHDVGSNYHHYHPCKQYPLWLCQNSYLKIVIYSGFTHWKWWFSIVMLVYQRVKSSKTDKEWHSELLGHILCSLIFCALELGFQTFKQLWLSMFESWVQQEPCSMKSPW
jgi:hypothetical protein